MNRKKPTGRTCILNVVFLVAWVCAVQSPVVSAEVTGPQGDQTAWTGESSRYVIELKTADGLYFTDAVRIDGESVGYFLVDTGSAISFVDGSVAGRHWEKTGSGLINQAIPFNLHRVRSISLGPVAISGSQIGSTGSTANSIFAHPRMRHYSKPVVGVLGMDILGRSPFTLDLSIVKPNLVLHDPARFITPKNVERQSITLIGRQPTEPSTGPIGYRVAVEAVINQVPAFVLIDSGANGELDLYDVFQKLHPQLKSERLPRGLNNDVITIGGAIKARETVRIEQCQLLGKSWKSLPQARIVPSTGLQAQHGKPVAGVVGTQTLSFCRLTFDLKNQSLWVEPDAYPALGELIRDKKVDIEHRDFVGLTLLTRAAVKGDYDAFSLLVQNGASMDVRANSEATIVHCAAWGGNDRILELIFKSAPRAGTWSNQRDKGGLTALHTAVIRGHLEVTARLLKEGAQIDALALGNNTALCHAVAVGDFEATNLLIKGGADVNHLPSNGQPPLVIAAINGDVKSYRLLSEHGARFPQKLPGGLHALHTAAKGGSPEIVTDVIAKLGDSTIDSRDSNDQTPLHIAAESGHIEAAKVLLDAGADLNARSLKRLNSHSIHMAARSGHAGFVEFLLDRGIPVDTKMGSDLTSLHIAAAYGRLDTVKLLVGRKASIRAVDAKRSTCLLMALSSGHEQTAKFIIECDPSLIGVGNNEGASAIHTAAERGFASVIIMMIKHRVDVSSVNTLQWQPIHVAAQADRTQVLQVLADEGADINAPGRLRMTPLHVAANAGAIESVRLLLKLGAKRDEKNDGGLTPSDMAMRAGHQHIISLLRDE